ncbi:MAG: rhodanese-like domain-containing protein [Aerococcus sp.]|nr:rhodanese-like domain-containing protein [Aerococcus sp.]
MEMTTSPIVKRLFLGAMSAVAVLTLSACGQQTDDQNAATSTSSAQTTSTASEVTAMKGDELDKILEDTKKKEKYLVLDVRKAEDYQAGTVKYAVNVPTDEIDAKADSLADYKDKNVVTIADTKEDSEKAAKALMDKGVTKVMNADGMKDFNYTVITKVQFVLADALVKAAESGDYTIIDSRDEKDYNAGHLKGAKHIDVNNLDEEIKSIPKDKPVMSYCYSGNKAYKAAQKLVDEGWTNVFTANDGTKEHDYDLVTD